MSKPLFILGKHRSGTTFLSNLLSEHPAIAAVISDRECGGIISGVFESGFFSCINGRYGDISNFGNYMEFASTVSCMEYFMYADCSLEELLSYYPADYPAVFRKIMEKVAAKKTAVYWMEKTPNHTLIVDRIKSYYPDAKFIGIIRDEADSALSALYLKKKQDENRFIRSLSLIKVTYLKSLYDRTMRNFSKRHPDDLFLISYESLINDTASVTANMCDFLGIEKKELETSRKQNTSFRTAQRKELHGYEQHLIRFFYKIAFRLAPICVLKAFYKLYRRSKPRQMPPWFFRTYRMNLSKDQRQHLSK